MKKYKTELYEKDVKKYKLKDARTRVHAQMRESLRDFHW